ncbi:MAG: pilin [Candidatus Dojkabacteria bacterium]|nr:pilin [Candidatus Dojkabacteria bacterium]
MIEKIVLNISKLLASPIYAQNEDTPPPKIELIFGPIENIFDMFLPIGALIAVAMIIYGGYLYIVSGGDPARKQLAQGTLTWSVIGLIFLFLIKAILTLILDFIGA